MYESTVKEQDSLSLWEDAPESVGRAGFEQPACFEGVFSR